MTVLQTYSENESKEDTKFCVDINEFYLRYHYNGKEYEINTHDLKDFYSIRLIGINPDKELEKMLKR